MELKLFQTAKHEINYTAALKINFRLREVVKLKIHVYAYVAMKNSHEK